MKLQQAAFAAAMTLALSAGAAQAGARIFGDSVLNVQDGFSDEITGDGPALVFIAGTQSPDALRDTVKALRKTSRVHLMRVTDASAARAYLDKRKLTLPADGSAPLPPRAVKTAGTY